MKERLDAAFKANHSPLSSPAHSPNHHATSPNQAKTLNFVVNRDKNDDVIELEPKSGDRISPSLIGRGLASASRNDSASKIGRGLTMKERRSNSSVLDFQSRDSLKRERSSSRIGKGLMAGTDREPLEFDKRSRSSSMIGRGVRSVMSHASNN